MNNANSPYAEMEETGLRAALKPPEPPVPTVEEIVAHYQAALYGEPAADVILAASHNRAARQRLRSALDVIERAEQGLPEPAAADDFSREFANAWRRSAESRLAAIVRSWRLIIQQGLERLARQAKEGGADARAALALLPRFFDAARPQLAIAAAKAVSDGDILTGVSGTPDAVIELFEPSPDGTIRLTARFQDAAGEVPDGTVAKLLIAAPAAEGELIELAAAPISEGKVTWSIPPVEGNSVSLDPSSLRVSIANGRLEAAIPTAGINIQLLSGRSKAEIMLTACRVDAGQVVGQIALVSPVSDELRDRRIEIVLEVPGGGAVSLAQCALDDLESAPQSFTKACPGLEDGPVPLFLISARLLAPN